MSRGVRGHGVAQSPTGALVFVPGRIDDHRQVLDSPQVEEEVSVHGEDAVAVGGGEAEGQAAGTEVLKMRIVRFKRRYFYIDEIIVMVQLIYVVLTWLQSN